ncbi:MAG TPA: tetratricopeptide repeat protein, partial [Urbifossiella sp.]|nr:tetratricopeptide repeat protein [Urbifossiella sp.]
PDDPEAYAMRGFLRLDAGENHRSTFDFDEAIRLDPKHLPAYVGRARAWRKMKLYDRALADAEEVLRLEPAAARGYVERGAAYEARGEWSRAVSDYNEVLRLDPGRAAVYQKRAWLRASCPAPGIRNAELAVADARRACELTDWKDPTALESLAAAEAESGRFAEAIASVDRALADAEYAKSPDGDGARDRRKIYEEGKAYRLGAAAEVPGEEDDPERTKRLISEVVGTGLIALVVSGLVAFRLRRFGVWPFARRVPPAVADDPPTPPGP